MWLAAGTVLPRSCPYGDRSAGTIPRVVVGLCEHEEPWLKTASDVRQGQDTPAGDTEGGPDRGLAPVGEVAWQPEFCPAPPLAVSLLQGEGEHAGICDGTAGAAQGCRPTRTPG